MPRHHDWAFCLSSSDMLQLPDRNLILDVIDEIAVQSIKKWKYYENVNYY